MYIYNFVSTSKKKLNYANNTTAKYGQLQVSKLAYHKTLRVIEGNIKNIEAVMTIRKDAV